MSDVPGSPKVIRCTSKPAALRIFSSTPSAPASAGVIEGQRSRSRAIERASVIPPLNMLARRWASTAPNKFQLAKPIPIRGGMRGAIDQRLQRIRAKPVGPCGPSQAQRFDKTPEAERGQDQHEKVRRVGIAKPVSRFAEQDRRDEERNDPPAALVAIVKPPDRGGRQEPAGEDHERY